MDVRYRIRDARADDLVAIAGIEERSFSDPWSVATLGDATADLALVADCNGRAVAYLFGRTAADEGEILNLAVADTHRRMGIGRALVRAALERFQDEGVRTVFLEVR